jgi:hypothetical protein
LQEFHGSICTSERFSQDLLQRPRRH